MRFHRDVLKLRCGLLAAVSLAALSGLAGPAVAQEVTGTPGSPSATTTIDGKYLPNPPAAFGGEINLSAKDSETLLAAANRAAQRRAQHSADHDRRCGLRRCRAPSAALSRRRRSTASRTPACAITQFHSTALCSPTRAALITGRNHHSVGFGVISEQATGYPGYDSIIGVDNATIGKILKQNGYATSWFGKNHNTPAIQYSAAGPFDQWPSGMGFDYFYGFMGGDSDQWEPYLFQNTTQIFPWVGKPGLQPDHRSGRQRHRPHQAAERGRPDKPFFVYYVPGATHAPHHPTQGVDRQVQGQVRHGLERPARPDLRQPEAARCHSGKHPAYAWPDDLPKWDTLDADSKKLFARQAEVFAAYAAYSDHEIGRVIQAVEDVGKLDNTLDHLHRRRQRHQR